MKNQEECPKGDTQKAIDAVVNIKDDVKKESQLIAFRADFESSKRIEVLEKMMHKNKTEVIKEAIKASFDGFLIRDTLRRLIPLIKKEFNNAKIVSSGLGFFCDDDVIPLNFSPDEGIFYVEFPEYPKSRSDDKTIKSGLGLLIFGLKIDGLKSITLEITMPLITADINKIDANLLKDLQIIALNRNLELKSSKAGRDVMSFEFKLERSLNISEKWVEYFIKDMKLLHESLQDIKKLACFEKSKSIPS